MGLSLMLFNFQFLPCSQFLRSTCSYKNFLTSPEQITVILDANDSLRLDAVADAPQY